MNDIQNPIPQSISPEEAIRHVRQQEAEIFDVREVHEFAQEHIAGAKSMPLSAFAPEHLPKDKLVIFYCGTGKRSCSAAQTLKQAGYGDAMIINGGIVGWKSDGLATEGDGIITQ